MKNKILLKYIKYVEEYPDDHEVDNYPVCFDEWYNNEYQEEMAEGEECDNVDCVSKNPKNIQKVKLTTDFGDGDCYWCEECRKRDKDMIKNEEEIDKEVVAYWEDIIYKDGKLDEEQVMKELSDFYFAMMEVPKVYCDITGGLLSKIMYPANVVLAEFNERFWDKQFVIEDIEQMMNSAETLEKLKEELNNYLI